jgi:hypothetical protein
LAFDRETRALFFKATAENTGRRYRYRSMVNDTAAEVVSAFRRKDGAIGSVRHHAFVPRFLTIGGEWYAAVEPTFVFTRDGYRGHTTTPVSYWQEGSGSSETGPFAASF